MSRVTRSSKPEEVGAAGEQWENAGGSGSTPTPSTLLGETVTSTRDKRVEVVSIVPAWPNLAPRQTLAILSERACAAGRGLAPPNAMLTQREELVVMAWRNAHVLVAALLVVWARAPLAQAPASGGTGSQPIDAAVIHPPMAARFTCSEHPHGSEDHAGDALGADCVVYRSDGGPFGKFNRFFAGDGTRNEDWFGWNQPLLAPFDGVVRLVLRNAVLNRPGRRGPDPATAILFERLGEPPGAPLQVGYVHVQDIQVAVGDTVRAGQVVARLGNNGNSNFPHLHVGAMRGDLVKAMNGQSPGSAVVPLQVRFDLAAMGRSRATQR